MRKDLVQLRDSADAEHIADGLGKAGRLDLCLFGALRLDGNAAENAGIRIETYRILVAFEDEAAGLRLKRGFAPNWDD